MHVEAVATAIDLRYPCLHELEEDLVEACRVGGCLELEESSSGLRENLCPVETGLGRRRRVGSGMSLSRHRRPLFRPLFVDVGLAPRCDARANRSALYGRSAVSFEGAGRGKAHAVTSVTARVRRGRRHGGGVSFVVGWAG